MIAVEDYESSNRHYFIPMGELFCALTRTSLFLIFPLTSKTRELDGVYVVEGMHMLHRTALHLTTHTVILLD